MTATHSKKNIRQQCRQARQSLNNKAIQGYSAAISKQILSHKAFKQAQVVASYMPSDNEVDTHLIHQACWQNKKKLLLPVVQNNKTMLFTEYQTHTVLIKNKFGIAEPQTTTKTIYFDSESIDCILIPLLAFDKKGNRIGYGGGYYDKYLSKQANRPTCIGLAFEIQKVSCIDKEEWDIAMDNVVTEEKTYLT